MQMHIEAPFVLDTWEGIADPAPEDDGAPAMGRALLVKRYTGEVLTGTATGHALTTQGPAGSSYVAQERVVGTLAGRTGSFVLEHGAVAGEGMEPEQRAVVVPGSGTGELAGLRGSGRLDHGLLTLDVRLPED